MRKIFSILFLCSLVFVKAQENSSIELNYFYGNIIEHTPELKPIIQSHPSGILFSWNKKNTENTQFNNTYNFPDYGFSFSYENFNNQSLGKVYSGYAHYNFYLTNRNTKNQVKLTSAIGLGYNTSPFDKVTNNKNWVIGSKFLGSAYLKLNYHREYILDKLGVNAGLLFLHYSNAGFKSPNLGINTIALNVGVNYNFNEKESVPERVVENSKINSSIRYNAIFRTGYNESLINGSGRYPFYTVSFSANKKVSYKSTISLGTEIFLATFMKDYIKHENSVNETPNETADWKRGGIFVGHELNLDKFSVITQVGYHIYSPYKYVSRVYERFGFRKRFNEHLFADLSLKINLFRAEGPEFGIGYRF